MNLARRTSLLAALFFLSVPSLRAQSAPDPSGHWEGKIQMPNQDLGMTVDLARSPKGVWIGSMSIPGSTSIDVPLSSLTVEGAAVRFTAGLPDKASFEGNLSADAKGLSGKASNAEGSAAFQLQIGRAHV